MSRQSQLFLFETRHAIWGESGAFERSNRRAYRYRLKIVWNPTLPVVNFIGLNPSIADERTDDHTIRRLKSWSRLNDYGGMIMSNIFALVSTDRQAMKEHLAPIGPENDDWLRRNAAEAALVVACWGTDGDHLGRGQVVEKMMRPKNLKCFRKTQKGFPEHPLYLPKNLPLIDYAS